MLFKFYESEFDGGSCINFGGISYSSRFIEIENNFNYIIDHDNKIKLNQPTIKNVKEKFNYGGFRGPQLTDFRKTIYYANGKKLKIVELDKDHLGFKFDRIDYDGVSFRIKPKNVEPMNVEPMNSPHFAM